MGHHIMHGGRLFPPSQNIRAPPNTRGGHTSCHYAAFVGRISHISGKIAVRIIHHSVGGTRSNVLMRQILLVWVDHVTIEVGLPDDPNVVRVVYGDMMVQGVTGATRDRGGGDGDRMGAMVWGGEDSFVDVVRVLGSWSVGEKRERISLRCLQR